MLKSTTDDHWLGLRPPQPDGRWWWWFIFDFVHNLTTWPHLRTPPACFLVWPNNILNKERQSWAWCRVKTADRKVAGLQRCAEPESVIPGPPLYSTVQYSTVQAPHCHRSGVIKSASGAWLLQPWPAWASAWASSSTWAWNFSVALN